MGKQILAGWPFGGRRGWTPLALDPLNDLAPQPGGPRDPVAWAVGCQPHQSAVLAVDSHLVDLTTEPVAYACSVQQLSVLLRTFLLK